jgi:hypothetical protein
VIEVYYQARFEGIKGRLTLKQDHVHFQSLKGDTMFMIDYLDITLIKKLPVPNADSIEHSDSFIR